MRNRSIPICLLILSLMQVRAAAQAKSAKEVVDQFCKLDANGERVTIDGQSDLAPLLLDARTSPQNGEITLTKEYSVRYVGVHQGLAEYAVEYRVLGRLDPSLRITRLQAAYLDRPVIESERISLVLSETYFDLGSDGQWQQVKGAPEWRIKTAPSTSHLNIGAAIAYVRTEGYKSKDPMIRANAQKSVRELQNLYQSQASLARLAQPAQKLPITVLSQFVTLESDGSGLTAEGLTELNQLLVHPRPAPQGKIRIAKTYAVRDVPFSGNRADLYVEYAPLGDLDSSLRFTAVSSNGGSVRENFQLILDNKYRLPARGNTPSKEFIGPSRWRIEDAPPDQWLTLDAASRYLEKTRDTTTNPAIRLNANKTLATLARYR